MIENNLHTPKSEGVEIASVSWLPMPYIALPQYVESPKGKLACGYIVQNLQPPGIPGWENLP